MVVLFLHLNRLRVKAPGAFVGLRTVFLPQGLDVLAAVRVQEQDHGMVLDVVEPLHCSGGDVQQRVLVLNQPTQSTNQCRHRLRCRDSLPAGSLTFSAIFLTVSSLITVEVLSPPPLRGTISVVKVKHVEPFELGTFAILNLRIQSEGKQVPNLPLRIDRASPWPASPWQYH